MGAGKNTGNVQAAESVKKQELSQDENTHTFSNASDGSFQYDYAVKSDYYKGMGVDESTGLKYALVSYDEKLWAVVVTKKSEFNGSYDTSSYTGKMSLKFKPATTKTVLRFSKNKTGKTALEKCFYYSDDYSILTTGFSKDIYYIDGTPVKGIKKVAGTYYFFRKGKRVDETGWYPYGRSQVYVKDGKAIFRFSGDACYSFTNGKKQRVTDRYISVKGTVYWFDATGALAQGMKQAGGEYYYLRDGVSRRNYYKKVDRYGYYFGEDGKAVRDTWVNVKNAMMYFNANARNTKTYYLDGYKDSERIGMYKIYSKNKWNFVTDGIYKIDGSFVYFKNGRHYTSTRWYSSNDTTMYYIRKGEVLYKRKQSGNGYVLYQANGVRWKKVSSMWAPYNKGKTFYYDKNGTSLYRYFNASYSKSKYRNTVWIYDAGSSGWQQVTDKLLNIHSDYYYIPEDGVIKAEEGWQTIDKKTAVYTDASGKVSKYIYYDKTGKYSIYREGQKLDQIVPGIVTVQINGKTVYYLMNEQGQSVSGSQSVDGYLYDFDKYGRAYSRRLEGSVYWDMDAWMKRVILAYLGKTNIYCNVFVDQAFALAGGDDPSQKLAVQYTSPEKGGILLDRMYTGTEWGGAGTVTGKVVLSDGKSWMKQDSIQLNSDIVDFSYDALTPGDVIVYYKNGETEASHVSLFLGKFKNAAAVKKYLIRMGVSKQLAEACVKDWGAYYDNDGTYWCIHGGMGSSSQVYISNSTYCIPASGNTYTYGRKIINVID
jgi:glucan-binding YG repeat protein